MGILNSKIIKRFLETICVKARGGYLRLKSQYINQIPIPKFFETPKIEDLVTQILDLHKKYSQLKDDVFDFIISKFAFGKMSTNLRTWHKLDFKEFLLELKKAKVNLSLSEEAEWMAYFNEQKAKAQELQAEINRIDQEIDRLVYELYGLTEEEIKIVEGSI